MKHILIIVLFKSKTLQNVLYFTRGYSNIKDHILFTYKENEFSL